jgi:isopropylmalate/homocitrate/citramalate synthase
MKNKLRELDVDFIGGQQPITKEEEFAISAFIRKQKEKRRIQAIRKSKTKASQKSHQPA